MVGFDSDQEFVEGGLRNGRLGLRRRSCSLLQGNRTGNVET